MIKKDHIVVFLVIIALVLGVIFYFNNPSEEQQIGPSTEQEFLHVNQTHHIWVGKTPIQARARMR